MPLEEHYSTVAAEKGVDLPVVVQYGVAIDIRPSPGNRLQDHEYHIEIQRVLDMETGAELITSQHDNERFEREIRDELNKS